MVIFYKWSIPERLYNIFPLSFVDRLTNCEFCLESHIGTLFSVFLFAYSGEYVVLTYGIMSASLSNLIKK